jgi:Bacterial archaeo-eukaryotic release factor family 3
VENRYRLAPLVQAFCEPERLLILALSSNSVGLYESEESRLSPIQLPEPFPTSLSEATKGTEFDRGLSYHTSAAHGRGTARVGIQTGHGTPKDDQKTLVTEYVRSVVKHLEPVLRHESSPLVLVAVQSLHPVFRELCRYPYLLEEGVMSSPDSLTDSELHRRAIEAAGPNRQANLQAAIERYRQMQRTDRIAYHIEQILPAIEHGRVDVLFAGSGIHIWGKFDGEKGVAVHRDRDPHDVDLLDLAICKTIENGRTAYVVDSKVVPSHEPLAAILKW